MESNSNDRLIFTLLFSVIIHVAVILGVSFNIFSSPTNAPVNNLDITLVKQQTLKAPEEADFLAQADNEGGGELDTPTPEPTADLPVPLTEDTPSSPPPMEMADVIPLETMPLKTPPATITKPEKIVESTLEPEPTPKPDPSPATKPKPETAIANEKLTRQSADRQVESTDVETSSLDSKEVSAKPAENPLSAKQMMAQAHSEITSLQDQLARSSKALSERPKKRRISAATKEFAAAAYMRAWEMKVERIGNMNYPQEARDKRINGSLMLSVDVRPDGSVPADGIVVSRSSGHKVLDNAAIKIVRLGAPYANIPDNVLQGNDMLTIIRTWKFESQRGLSAR